MASTTVKKTRAQFGTAKRNGRKPAAGERDNRRPIRGTLKGLERFEKVRRLTRRAAPLVNATDDAAVFPQALQTRQFLTS